MLSDKCEPVAVFRNARKSMRNETDPQALTSDRTTHLFEDVAGTPLLNPLETAS